jgi:hypothetical protein
MSDKTNNKNSENNENQSPRWTEQDKRLWQYAAKRVRHSRRLPAGTYDKLIEYLRTKPLGSNVEKHHVIPLHDG